nr:Acetyltransferase (GNAT) family [Klebsiella pneumoniae]
MIRDNHAAVALYQSLGFTRRYGLCGYLSTELLPRCRAYYSFIPPCPCFGAPLRRVTASFLAAGSAYLRHSAMSGRDAGTARLRGSNDGGLAPCTVVLWVEPAARRQGLARELLMALAQQFPGIGTSVTVPETFTPLFAAAGYAALTLQQYEMSATMNALRSAGR